ncbi:VgrG protein [Pseudomonas aeruginosa RB]|nr:VgrG protein [Pseudomonas aeruginosa RB]
MAAQRSLPRRQAAAGAGRERYLRHVGQHGRLPAGLPQPLPRDALGGVLPPAAGAPEAARAGQPDRGGDRPARRGNPLRPLRPGQGAVPLGPRGPGRRQEQLLAARSQRLGRQRLWRHRHSAGRHGSAGGLPRRRSRPAAGQRLRLPRRPPGALRVAGEPDPQRLQEPQQPWRRWLQRAAHRGSQGPGTDLRPCPARLGREHRA